MDYVGSHRNRGVLSDSGDSEQGVSMTTWVSVFLSMAHAISRKSKDRTRVGAVIVDERNRVVSCGFNGAPWCFPDNHPALQNHDGPGLSKRLVVRHAEQNAISFAHRDLSNCTIYCTHPPCADCASAIAQAGIRKVVHDGGGLKSDWHSEEAQEILRVCGVIVQTASEAAFEEVNGV